VIPEQFVLALDGFEAVAVGVPADRWDAPSPCEGWSAADVVDHVAGGLRAIQSLGADGTPEGGSAAGADSLDRWRAARAELLAILDDAGLARQVSLPWGARMPLGEYIGRYPLELVVHTWDLAKATGQALVIDPDLVRDALATAVQFAPAGRAAGMIGPEREAAEDADDLTRLLAIFGRQAT
jgi:uncharacterized protein (TIGR03086 family)